VGAIGAVLRFDVAADEQSVELQRMLRVESAEQVVLQVCGLDAAHPLFASVVREVRRAQGL
jgi:mannitol-1-phosphate 5-dehydrogenase